MNKCKSTMLRFAIAILACGALSAIPAVADTITSDTLTVYDATGQAVYSVSSSTTIAAGGSQLFYVNTPGLANLAMVDKYTFVCAQPNCAASGSHVNEVLGVFPVMNGGQLSHYLGFMENGPWSNSFGGSAITTVLNGAGGVSFDMTPYLATDKQAAGWTASFVIDPLVPSVPEPGTVTLLGSGMLALGGLVRRYGKKW